MRNILVSFMFLSLLVNYSHAEIKYDISFRDNGFYNYDHNKGVVIFQEKRDKYSNDGQYLSTKHYIVEVDLNNKAIIKFFDLEKPGGCIGFEPKVSPTSDKIISFNYKSEKFLLYEPETDRCQSLSLSFKFSNFLWSRDGKKVLFKDKTLKKYYRMDVEIFDFEEYSEPGVANFIVWSDVVNSELYSFIPLKYLQSDNVYYTSDNFDYYYILSNKWIKYDEKHPLINDTENVSFRRFSDIEAPPVTEFFDVDLNKKISVANDLYIGHKRNYVLWLGEGWVYFQGGKGVFNYHSNKFNYFSDGSNTSIPFSVDQDRYAILHDNKINVLKVYDLKTMELMNTYKPFWRE